jgi:hypothetical protein
MPHPPQAALPTRQVVMLRVEQLGGEADAARQLQSARQALQPLRGAGAGLLKDAEVEVLLAVAGKLQESLWEAGEGERAVSVRDGGAPACSAVDWGVVLGHGGVVGGRPKRCCEAGPCLALRKSRRATAIAAR